LKPSHNEGKEVLKPSHNEGNKGKILYTKEEKGGIFHTMKEQTVEYTTLARKRKIIHSHSEGKSSVN
jgi:hypothetical protein